MERLIRARTHITVIASESLKNVRESGKSRCHGANSRRVPLAGAEIRATTIRHRLAGACAGRASPLMREPATPRAPQRLRAQGQAARRKSQAVPPLPFQRVPRTRVALPFARAPQLRQPGLSGAWWWDLEIERGSCGSVGFAGRSRAFFRRRHRLDPGAVGKRGRIDALPSTRPTRSGNPESRTVLRKESIAARWPSAAFSHAVVAARTAVGRLSCTFFVTAMAKAPERPRPPAPVALVGRIREILESARTSVVRTVNTTQVVTNWMIGREIVEAEQRGRSRAEYGARLLAGLSAQLTRELGRGWSVDNLEAFRQFYLQYPQLISETVSRISGSAGRSNSETPSRNSAPIEDPEAVPEPQKVCTPNSYGVW